MDKEKKYDLITISGVNDRKGQGRVIEALMETYAEEGILKFEENEALQAGLCICSYWWVFNDLLNSHFLLGRRR